MNKTNYYIECLELMGFKVFAVHGGWRVEHYDENLCIDFGRSFTNEELIAFTIQELIKRDGVLERVFDWAKKDIGRWLVFNVDLPSGPGPVQRAITLGITPRELMGVEG